MTTLVTGGAGFIGLNYVKYLQKQGIDDVFVIDKMGYASNQHELDKTRVGYEVLDISDRHRLQDFFNRRKITDIVHFAAESHVDNSIKDCLPFVESNVLGTVNLLDCAIKHDIQRFVHISTDEVFGDIEYPDKFNEDSKIAPRNPYSASKASAEHFVMSYGNTHKLPYIMINSSNNYGPYQHHEKLIPMTINRILNNQKIGVYGDGSQIRDWIYVEDTCSAIHKIFTAGKLMNRYCVGGNIEVRNIDLVTTILCCMDSDLDLIEFVKDRPGHDIRYATDISKIQNELNWNPDTILYDGLKKTIAHIKENK